MANVFQKIFLSKNKIREIDQQREIFKLLSMAPVTHQAKLKSNGGTVRHFQVTANENTIHATRLFEPSLPKELQVKYNLVCFATKSDESKHVKYATHSDVDKFAKRVYEKMYKIWELNKQNVK